MYNKYYLNEFKKWSPRDRYIIVYSSIGFLFSAIVIVHLIFEIPKEHFLVVCVVKKDNGHQLVEKHHTLKFQKQ